MKEGSIFLTAIFCVILVSGCAKEQAVEQLPAENQAAQVMMEEPTEISQTPVTAQATVMSPTPVSGTVSTPPQLPVDSVERAKLIQTALRNLNLYTGEIDGKIGPLTTAAIKEFQRTHQLTVDGKVGPLTWAELANYVSSPVASAAEGVQE